MRRWRRCNGDGNADRVIAGIEVRRIARSGVDAHAIDGAGSSIRWQLDGHRELQEVVGIERDLRVITVHGAGVLRTGPRRRCIHGRRAEWHCFRQTRCSRPRARAAVDEPYREGARAARLAIGLVLRLLHGEIGRQRSVRRRVGWRRSGRSRVNRDADIVRRLIWTPVDADAVLRSDRQIRRQLNRDGQWNRKARVQRDQRIFADDLVAILPAAPRRRGR